VVFIGGSVGGPGALRAGLDDKAGADGVVCLSAAGSDEVTESVRRVSPTLDWQPGCAGRADAVEVHERGGGDEFG
jgi:hypothetical protein